VIKYKEKKLTINMIN